MSTYESTRTGFSVAVGRRSASGGFIEEVRLLLRTWRKRARDRQELALMGDQGLRDIRADRASVDLEVTRAFWQGWLLTRR
jgi:uncharacterized protein YjiS (DUF1127 family)